MSGIQQKADETNGVKIEVDAQEKVAEISDGGIQADIEESELKEPKLVLMGLLSKKTSVPDSKQYQRKVFMQVEESRTPGQWIDYGKCHGITDDKLLPTILKGMSNLTVDRYDKDVQNIMSRIETGTPVVQDQLPSRLNACTIYPEPECSFGIAREMNRYPDASQKEIPKETEKTQPDASNHVTPKIVNTPITGTTSNFASSFGPRRNAYPFTTPMCNSAAKNITVRPVLQSFFEEQSSTPNNMCVGADGDRANLVKEIPQNLSLGGAPSVFHKSASGSPLFSNPVVYPYQSSPVPLYPSYHVNTPAASIRSGNVPLKVKVEDSAVSSNANVASSTLATAAATMERENPNALFFGLLMAEFNSLSVTKQKALKKAIMNLVYED